MPQYPAFLFKLNVLYPGEIFVVLLMVINIDGSTYCTAWGSGTFVFVASTDGSVVIRLLTIPRIFSD